MNLVECSAKKFARMSKKRKIVCFGAGGRLQQLFDSFADLKIEEQVECILDNDRTKWGEFRNLNGVEVEVKSPDYINELNADKYIFLISTFQIKEVFSQIQNITHNAAGICIGNVLYRYQFGFWLEKVLNHLPLRNSILLQGEGDTCDNAVSLVRELQNRKSGIRYNIYWLCNRPEMFCNSKNIKYIKRNSNILNVGFFQFVRYILALNLSKYLIFENQFIPKHRCNQISVYLNHGSPPLKATKGIINLPKDLNYAVCPSENCASIVSEQYGINKERLLYCGSPRTDTLFMPSKHNGLKTFLSTEGHKKVVLWAPTFREHFSSRRVDTNRSYKKGIPIIETDNDYDRISFFLKENNILLVIKPHLLQDLTKLKIRKNDNICIIYQDDLNILNANIFDLMKLSDAMITDYSTIAFDFMLIDRPIAYTIDDMEDYKIGFSVPYPFEYMPGNKIRNIDQLLDFLNQVLQGIDLYEKERRSINRYIHSEFADEKNSERLVRKLGL